MSSPSKVVQCAREESPDAPPLKKLKVALAPQTELLPQMELMRPCPMVPPRASGTRTISLMREKELLKQGMQLPLTDFGSKDLKLWSKSQGNLFRAKSKCQNKTFASAFMRWWFKEHHGMPCNLPPRPRSAYSLFFSNKKKEMPKVKAKKLGAMWKALSDADKAPFLAQFETLKEQERVNQDKYYELMGEWQRQKEARLAASGETLNNVERSNQGLGPICRCNKCVDRD